ncbi:MAG TPA: SCO family protein [Sphingomicrobium sp.]|nr:SCO family protein [Sphingomicrobium sp.]
MNEIARRGLLRGLLLCAILLLAGFGAWTYWRPASTPNPADANMIAIGGPFTLTDVNGRPFGSEQLRGKPFAIFFGFTRCPDVCPTTLSRMVRLRSELGKEAESLNLVFVSVDPRSDKPQDIAQYLSLFDSPIIGLTGTQHQLAEVKRNFGVFSEEVPLGNSGYTIDHTATVFVVDADGRFVGTLDAHEDAEAALAKLRRSLTA